MKSFIFAALLAVVNVVVARSCSEADRFGDLTVSPTTVSPGDTITVNVDLTCSVQNFGFDVKAIDYSIEVLAPDNSGFPAEAPVILGRHNIAAGALSDSVTATVPHAFFNASAPYNLVVTNIHNINGTDGSPVLTSGGAAFPITINA